MRTMKIGRTIPPHGGNGKQTGGNPIMRLHHKEGLNTDRTGKPVIISESSIYLWNEDHKRFWCTIYSDYIGNSQQSLLSPTGCVKSTCPDTAFHEQNGYEKLLDHKYNILMTNVDNYNSDKTYTNMHNQTHHWPRLRCHSFFT